MAVYFLSFYFLLSLPLSLLCVVCVWCMCSKVRGQPSKLSFFPSTLDCSDWTQVIKRVWQAFWPDSWLASLSLTMFLYIAGMHFCLMTLVVTGTFWITIFIPISILDRLPPEASKASPCYLRPHLSFLCSILTAAVFIWYHLPLPPNFQKEYLVILSASSIF